MSLAVIASSHSPAELIEKHICVIRNHRVMLDRDLAQLYDVKAIALRQQVKRNRLRFPKDFLFQPPRRRSIFSYHKM